MKLTYLYKGEYIMFKLINGTKTIATNENAFELLKDATDFNEKGSHAAILTWCGTDKAFYEEVTTFEPQTELTDKTWIIGDGDYFATITERATVEELNDALSEIHSHLTIVEA